MAQVTYEDVLKKIISIRENGFREKSPNVPKTLPIGPVLGEEKEIPVGEKTVTVFFHRPEDGKSPYPVYFNFHGGGMAAGCAQQDEFLCHQISKETGIAVVNVEYPLAPEHPFPEGIMDSYETIRYMLAHASEYGIDADRVAFGGQSAGGNIAVVMSILANREKDIKYRGVSICYPGLSMESENLDKGTPNLDSVTDLYAASYSAGGGNMHDPLASPVLASDNDLKDIPSMLIMTGELDALRFDAEKLAVKLMKLNVPVVFKQFANCAHGFTHRAYKEEPQQAIRLFELYLKHILF